MNRPQQPAGHLVRWVQPALPWVFVLALSACVAYVMNTAVVRALSTNGRTDVVSAVVRDARNVCALDVDLALYDRVDWWLPAGRSDFCRAETHPGEPGPYEVARQLSYAGPLQATITFMSPNDIRIDLYCLTSRHERSADAVSVAEARHLYDLICASAGGLSPRAGAFLSSIDPGVDPSAGTLAVARTATRNHREESYARSSQ